MHRYLTVSIVIISYIGYKLVRGTKIRIIAEMDVTTGARDFDATNLMEEERERQMDWPRWRRIYKWFC